MPQVFPGFSHMVDWLPGGLPRTMPGLEVYAPASNADANQEVADFHELLDSLSP